MGVEALEPRLPLSASVADTPWVQSVTLPAPRTYGQGQVMSFVLRFNERVEVDPTATLPVEVGIARRQAEYVSGSGSRSVVFRMRVASNDLDTDGIRLGRLDPITGLRSFDLGRTVRDLQGHRASDRIPATNLRRVLVDGAGPRVASFGAFATQGHRVVLRVQFDEPVVIRGTPTIPATIDGEPVVLRYISGGARGSARRSATFVLVAPQDLGNARVAFRADLGKVIQLSAGASIRDRTGNAYGAEDFQTGDLVIDREHGPVRIGARTTLTVTPTGKITSDLLVESGAVTGEGDGITVVNNGVIDTVLGNNAPAIFIEGDGARVSNNGELRLGGNNSPGIEIRGDDAVVENQGFIHSELVGSQAAGPGHVFGNNEGISVDGLRAKVTVGGRFEGRAGNAEYVSLSGDDLTLIADASAETFGEQSEVFSISGLKSHDPAIGFNASVRGVYKTHGRESEFLSITAIGGTLDVNASFESFGDDSEGVSITGDGIASTIAGSITTHAGNSEGVSIQSLDVGAAPGPLTTTIAATIKTFGKDSEGVSVQANGAQLTVSGNITTEGNDAEGISVVGKGVALNVVDVSGDIATKGKNSEGVSLSGNGISAKLAGAIVTTGDDSEGLSIVGDNMVVEINGSISTSGAHAPAILINGSNITVIINGPIATTGAGSPAILVLGGTGITITGGPNAAVSAASSPKFQNPNNAGVTINNLPGVP